MRNPCSASNSVRIRLRASMHVTGFEYIARGSHAGKRQVCCCGWIGWETLRQQLVFAICRNRCLGPFSASFCFTCTDSACVGQPSNTHDRSANFPTPAMLASPSHPFPSLPAQSSDMFLRPAAFRLAYSASRTRSGEVVGRGFAGRRSQSLVPLRLRPSVLRGSQWQPACSIPTRRLQLGRWAAYASLSQVRSGGRLCVDRLLPLDCCLRYMSVTVKGNHAEAPAMAGPSAACAAAKSVQCKSTPKHGVGCLRSGSACVRVCRISFSCIWFVRRYLAPRGPSRGELDSQRGGPVSGARRRGPLGHSLCIVH